MVARIVTGLSKVLLQHLSTIRPWNTKLTGIN